VYLLFNVSSQISNINILHLFISPGHNFGRDRLEAGDYPTLEVDKVNCLAGRGLEGDRYCDHKPNYKGQATFFSYEVFEHLSNQLGCTTKHVGVLRRNIITRGIDLNSLIGVEFEIQGVKFRGMQECSPCRWMDHAFSPGAHKAMMGKGGLRAQILSDGYLITKLT